MENNFKKLQEIIEAIPRAKPEAHFIINDIAKKYLNKNELNQDEINDLELMWSQLQALDIDLIRFFDTHRSKGIISKLETLIVADFLLISKQIGPDCEKIIDAIYQQNLNLNKFTELATSTSIPSNTRQVIISLYKKITGSEKTEINSL